MADEMNKSGKGFTFRAAGDDGMVDVLPGIKRRTLVWSERTLLAEFRLAAGSKIPEHHHPEEQTGCLISGRMVFFVAGERREVAPGDAWVFAGGTPHAVNVVEDSVVVEAFAPAREDYK